MEAEYYFVIIIPITIFPQGETAMTFKERLKEPEIRKKRPFPYFHKKKQNSKSSLSHSALGDKKALPGLLRPLQSIGRHLLSSYSWGR